MGWPDGYRLTAEIREVHAASREAYGSPRVYRRLRRGRVRVGRKRVERLMRRADLRGRVRRRHRTTGSNHEQPVASNLLNRDFVVAEPDRVWASDITYNLTLTGWCYLTVGLDLHSRLVVGWSVAAYMRTELVSEALGRALGWRRPASRMLHHSDRDSQ